MQQFSIIIPTLNEAGNIKPLLHRLEDTMQKHSMSPELIFVDDGSEDGTRQIIEKYKGFLKTRLIIRDEDRGLTGAVVEGARSAENDFILVIDADLSHPPELIPELIAPVLSGKCDVSVGSRYTDGGKTVGWPASRRIISQIASLPARWLTGICDPLTGFFAAPKQRIVSVDKNLSGFKIGLELLANTTHPPKVQEIPISFQDRWTGYSKMNALVLVQYMKQLMRLSTERIVHTEWAALIPVMLVLAGIDVCLSAFIPTLGPVSEVASWFISLFTIAHLGYFFFPSINEHGRCFYSIRTYLNFIILLFMSIFVRNGLLALPSIQSDALSIAVQFFSTAICLSAIILLSKSDLFGFRCGKINWNWFGGTLIFYAVAIRLIYLGNVELLQEEAYYWNYAQHMAPGYLDHPPVVALFIKIGTFVFGNSELGVRILAFLSWFVTAFFAHRFTTEMFDKDSAFRAVMLIAILPIFFSSGLLATPDAPLIACWSAGLYYLYRALVLLQGNAWYGAGVFIGLGLASKYTMALLGPAIVIFMLIDRSARTYFLRPQPYLAAILALGIFSPVIWWNYQHEWASFLFQSQDRIQASSEFSTHELIGSILVLLSPTGLIAAVAVFRKWFLKDTHNSKGKFPDGRSYRFGLTMLLVPLAVFTLFSFSKEIKLNWTGPLWLSIIPFVAYATTNYNECSRLDRILAGTWPKTLVTLMLCYGAILHYSVLGFPGVQQRNFAFLLGWNDFAVQVDNKVDELMGKNGQAPMVAGMDKYKIASGLAFYRSKLGTAKAGLNPVDETTGRQLFGHGSLMYEYWHPPGIAENRDILVIANSKGKLTENIFQDRCEKIGKIQNLQIRKHGKIVDRYYYRVLSGYTPQKNREEVNSEIAQHKADNNHNILTL